MFRLTQNRWFRRIALGAVAAIGLGTAMVPTAPAQARVYVGIGFPGVYAAPAPYYSPYSYGYGYGYYPYYTPYYAPAGLYFGGGGYYHGYHGGRHWHR